MLGLHCCVGFSLVVVSGGYSLVAVVGLLIAVTSLPAAQALGVQTSVAAAHRLSSCDAQASLP